MCEIQDTAIEEESVCEIQETAIEEERVCEIQLYMKRECVCVDRRQL